MRCYDVIGVWAPCHAVHDAALVVVAGRTTARTGAAERIDLIAGVRMVDAGRCTVALVPVHGRNDLRTVCGEGGRGAGCGGGLLPNSVPCVVAELVHVKACRLTFPSTAHRNVISVRRPGDGVHCSGRVRHRPCGGLRGGVDDVEIAVACHGQILAVGGIGDVVKPVLAVRVDGIEFAAGLDVDDGDFAVRAAVSGAPNRHGDCGTVRREFNGVDPVSAADIHADAAVNRRKVAAVVDVDGVVVEGRSDVHAVWRVIHAVHVRSCINRANVGPCAGVPDTNKVVFRARDDEFTVGGIVNAVIIAV